jgi:hypothetical protein
MSAPAKSSVANRALRHAVISRLALYLILLGCAGNCRGWAQSTMVTVTVSSGPEGAALASDFLGLSFGMGQ